MKFSEFPLYAAIWTIRNASPAGPFAAGLSSDPQTAEDREKVFRAIQGQLAPDVHYTLDECCKAWVGYRKRGRENDLAVMVGLTHGAHCFWQERGRGRCDGQVSVDRLVPGARGGQYKLENCVIACQRHNSMRGDLTIEEFLGERATGQTKNLFGDPLEQDAEAADARFGRRSR